MNRIIQSFKGFTNVILISYIYLFIIRFIQLIWMDVSLFDAFVGLWSDLLKMNVLLFVMIIPFALMYHKSEINVIIIFKFLVFIFFFTGMPLWVYFFNEGELLNPWMHDCSFITTYSKSFEHDLPANFAVFLIFAVILFFHIYILRNKSLKTGKWVAVFSVIFLIVSIPLRIEQIYSFNKDEMNTAIKNPVFYTYGKQINCIIGIDDNESQLTGNELLRSKYAEEQFLMPEEYPLLRTMPEIENGLSDYFSSQTKDDPDIVFLLLDGLYNEFTREIFGVKFMPFLSSLADSSLYWDQHFSVSKSAQNFIPAFLAGLPHAENGFSNQLVIPHHFSVVNILHDNGYTGNFYTAQWAWEQSLEKYFTQNRVQFIYDADDYPENTPRVLVGDDQYHWGVSDKFLFDQYFEMKNQNPHEKTVDLIYSKGIRSPFSVHDPLPYQNWIDSLIRTESNTSNAEHFELYKPYYTALLFADAQLKSFFERYSQLPGFDNTIFIITGSNPVPEFPYTVRLREYKVPLLIYSPMMKQPVKFDHFTTHFDFYHSFLDWMNEQYDMKIPEFTTSFGFDLLNKDVSKERIIPLMDGNNKIFRTYSPEYIIWDEDNLHKTEKPFEPLNDEMSRRFKPSLTDYREAYLNYNSTVKNQVIPDSLFFDFFDFSIIDELKFDKKLVRTEFNDLIESMRLENSDHYIDIEIKQPEVSLEEVYLVTEIRNENDSILEWKSYGIPDQNKDYGVKTTLPEQNDDYENLKLKTFIWNQSPVPYSYEAIEIRIYKNKEPE